MARIYYREEKIYGKPIETEVINLKNFKWLMECRKPSRLFNFGPDSSGGYRDWFATVHISIDGREYCTEPEGHFYLPNAIIFTDRDDYTFPSLFYFIAQIGTQLEIRSVEGGENVKWSQIADLHRPVEDASIIRKMEYSLHGVLALLKDYKEPEKPKAPRIAGVTLALQDMEKFLSLLDVSPGYAPQIVDMAQSPSDYFEANEKNLRKCQILEPSRNMHLLYLASLLEENGKIAIVEWKESYSDVVRALNRLGGYKKVAGGGKYKRSTAGKILSELNGQIESDTDKTIFCIDTNSDSYSFGLVDKTLMDELRAAGDKLGIKIFTPSE